MKPDQVRFSLGNQTQSGSRSAQQPLRRRPRGQRDDTLVLHLLRFEAPAEPESGHAPGEEADADEEHGVTDDAQPPQRFEQRLLRELGAARVPLVSRNSAGLLL
jgi:hypothetical protein